MSTLSVVGSGYYGKDQSLRRISIEHSGLPQLYDGSCIDPQPQLVCLHDYRSPGSDEFFTYGTGRISSVSRCDPKNGASFRGRLSEPACPCHDVSQLFRGLQYFLLLFLFNQTLDILLHFKEFFFRIRALYRNHFLSL